MRSPSRPLGYVDTRPLARWGIEVRAGWRGLVERTLARLEAEIAAQPLEQQAQFRVVDIKAKFGRLTIHLEASGTATMEAAIHDAFEESARLCEVCSAPGELAERGPTGWWSTRCRNHEDWSPHDEAARLN